MTIKRVSVYVDGLNLYHAIKNHQNKFPQSWPKNFIWIDLWVLSECLVRSENEKVTTVKYFSAFATWRRRQSYRRHQRYVSELQSCGVQFIEGNFKEKEINCRNCNSSFTTYEEKETDVNIGAHLLADALQNRFDRALVVSADSDLNQAVTLARNESNHKLIDIVAPPGRMSQNSFAMFPITKGKLRKAIFPPEIINRIEG